MTKAVQKRQPKDDRHGADDRPKGWAIGAVLRETREQRGFSLEDVSENINIRTQQLEAIENAEFDKLPGMTYAIGFIRSYAQLLELDAENLVRHYKDEFGAVDTKPDLDAPAEATPSQVPGIVLAAGAAVLAVIVLVIWVIVASGEEEVAQIPEVPPELASEAVNVPQVTSPVLGDTSELPADMAGSELAMTEQAVPAEPVEPVADQAVTAQNPATPTVEDFGRELSQVYPDIPPPPPTSHSRDASILRPGAVVTRSPADAAVAQQPAQATQPSQPAQPASQPPASRIDSRITLVANRTSWVEVYEEDGDVLMTRVMKKGERYLVPDRGGILLTTGNAGALDVLVDGQEVRPIGNLGDVMRGVELDAETLLRR